MAIGVLDVYAVNSTINCFFSTNAAAGAAVAPGSAFENADVLIYKNGSATQRTSTAGTTMTSPFDSIVGLHLFAADTSDDTDAGFWATGNEYTFVLSPDETVDSQTPITAVIARFRLGPSPADVISWSGTAIPGVDTAGYPKVTIKDGTGTGEIDTASGKVPATIAAGDIANAAITAAAIATGAIDADAIATDAVTEFVAGLLNTVNNGSLYNIANSIGKQIRQASGYSFSIRTGTAQTGSTSSTIKLDAAASSTNNIYQGAKVVITGGTGVGQQRNIIAYSGSTKIATVDKNWVTTPDNTSTFDLQVGTLAITSQEGTAQAGSATTITLASTANATDDYYNNSLVSILSGTGAGQTREITDYVGATKVATVAAWSTNPDNTSVYAVIPAGGNASDNTPAAPTASEITSVLLARNPTVRNLSAVTSPTVEDALTAALAQGAGAWAIVGTTLTLLNLDGSTFRTFTLDAAPPNASSRT
jgi:hypothetical protein